MERCFQSRFVAAAGLFPRPLVFLLLCPGGLFGGAPDSLAVPEDHPVFRRRRWFEGRNPLGGEDFDIAWFRPDGRRVKVAGLVLLRQRPGTASGITFVTLEDETGFANLIVRPDVWERFHHVARTAQAMLVRGLLQRQGTIIHVLADKLEDLSSLLSDMNVPSRDFR